MVNAKLHIICGNCGCNHMFNYAIKICTDDSVEPEAKYQDVTITCDNCNTIHWLNDNAEME